jgi:hypothetical protein
MLELLTTKDCEQRLNYPEHLTVNMVVQILLGYRPLDRRPVLEEYPNATPFAKEEANRYYEFSDCVREGVELGWIKTSCRKIDHEVLVNLEDSVRYLRIKGKPVYEPLSHLVIPSPCKDIKEEESRIIIAMHSNRFLRRLSELYLAVLDGKYAKQKILYIDVQKIFSKSKTPTSTAKQIAALLKPNKSMK